MKPKLGLVGLGNIGEPICRCLLENGYEVYIYDANPEAVAKLSDTPAEPAGNLKDLARSTEVVLLSLPNSDVVERVVLGDGGLAEGLSSGKVLIDTSSSRPSSTRTIAERLAGEGAEMLDAPVSRRRPARQGGRACGDGRGGEGGLREVLRGPPGLR